MDWFFEIHRDNLQEGPGDASSTERALAVITGLPREPRILDAGCGPGRQTLQLCRLLPGTVTAVDNHPPYLEALGHKVKKAGLDGRVRLLEADMAALPFEPGSFDLIWSEGAIYNIGFRQGLELWRPLLKPGGWIAVTDLTLLRDNLPEEPATFWNEEYPAAQKVEDNLADLESAGFSAKGNFTLPESAWWDYYRPIEDKLAILERQHAACREAMEVLAAERKEIDLYRRYSDYYGYQFYIGRRAF